MIAEEWMSLTGIFNSHLMMAQIVQRFGTARQKEYWLPRFATGEIRGGLGLTEPDAGTDLQAIRTTAKRVGDKYVVNGAKTWISNAIQGHASALLVKTDPSAEPRYKGMSMLIVTKMNPETGEALPGIRNGKKLEKLGYKGIDSGEFIFEDYECDAELSLVGGEEGQGFFMATPPAGLRLAASISPRAPRSALPAGRCVKASPTPRPARRWASRSASIRRSS